MTAINYLVIKCAVVQHFIHAFLQAKLTPNPPSPMEISDVFGSTESTPSKCDINIRHVCGVYNASTSLDGV